MNPIDNDTVKSLIQTRLSDANITVESDGYHYYVTVISEQFTGKMTVQRHKMIYAILNEVIANGTLHALALKTHTPLEQQQKNH